jgi:hypothetical protein
MRLCEIEDQEKLKLILKGNVLNNLEQFNEYKASLRNKPTSVLRKGKNAIVSNLNKTQDILINAIITLHNYENDAEAESLIDQYEQLLGKLNSAKYMTNIEDFSWIKR